jgi:tight adherence protein B
MDPWRIAFLILVFLSVVLIVMSFNKVWSDSRFPKRKAMKKRLMYIGTGGMHGKEKLDLYKKSALQHVGFFDRLALTMPRLLILDRMLVRTGMPCSAVVFIFISILLGGLGILVGITFSLNGTLAAGLGGLLLVIPFLYLKIKENEFFSKFEEQFPEALDLLARALRVGHALSSGIEMVAEEMDDPIKSEFAATLDDINLGLSVKDAFENLCERVPNTDLRFFTIAVLIQRETGGSLAKMLDNLSTLIRKRMQFRRKVKSLTAEGRISANILVILPIGMFAYLYCVNYDYISLLWTNRVGLYMLSASVCLVIVGMIIMKKMIAVEL